MAGAVLTFGPFTLDTGTRRLWRDGVEVVVSDRQLEVLLALTRQPGQVVSKDALISQAWPDVAVGDNSLEQVISSLRRVVGPGVIETRARRGYRFAQAVTVGIVREDDAGLEALLRPHRAFLEGRAALESLDPDAIAGARLVFDRLTREMPDSAPARVGLANALALEFESTRAEQVPAHDLLRSAFEHGREACRLDPELAEAWATLGFVTSRLGETPDAIAALRRAVTLEPDNWRHQLRLASAAWGEERLRAARRALQLLPGVGLAHWLAASVHVARQALAEADRELRAGLNATEHQAPGARFSAVGLHLLLGLVRLAVGHERDALDHLHREVAARMSHLYGREACANAWCAIAAIRQRHGDTAGVVEALAAARTMVPTHPGATVPAALVPRTPAAVFAALRDAPPGPAEWTLPVDPVLNVSSNPAEWNAVLALLRSRAA